MFFITIYIVNRFSFSSTHFTFRDKIDSPGFLYHLSALVYTVGYDGRGFKGVFQVSKNLFKWFLIKAPIHL